MDDAKVVTIDEIREQVRAREEELSNLHGDADPDRSIGRVQARDEALERMCTALQYLQNSLVEVKSTRMRLDLERGLILRELRDVRAKADELDAELRSVRLAHREIDRQMENDEPDIETTPSCSR